MHQKADDAAPVLVTYQNGETISVLAKKGEWVEVRTGDRSGLGARGRAHVGGGSEGSRRESVPEVPRHVIPVTAPGAKGEIYLEADVNSDGEVLSVRVLLNTTGSPTLLDRNIGALEQAQFYPIVQKGERKGFKYYHRVTY